MQVPGGVGKNRDSESISGFLACCERFERQVQSLSSDRPWRVDDISRWFVDATRRRLSVRPSKHHRYAEDNRAAINGTQW